MDQETFIRVMSFMICFTLVAVGEHLAPRRILTVPRRKRWVSNVAILLLNPLSVRLFFNVLPVSLAVLAAERQWGLLNNLALPFGVEVVIAIIVLDLIIYLQHVLFHTLPLLWRLHMVHHADLDIDVTTGVRFHPLEIFISMGVKLAAVALLGPPALSVLLFEVVLNATSMFNHSNTHIPVPLDRFLRLILVTPDMHRVHHSVIIRETNSNYGFNFPWWDRLLGTYKNQPEKGHADMAIGLAQFRHQEQLGLWRLLLMPFVEGPGRIPINRH